MAEMIKENLNRIICDIKNIAKNAGRNENDVKLLAVSKFHPVEEIIEASDAGQILFGENRVQEACEKFQKLNEENIKFSLHMIGSLQTNKVRNIVKYAECIQSVDRLELLKEIEKQCAKIDRKINILFEIHTGEESKAGFQSEEDLDQTLRYCVDNNAPHVIPRGFMTMAPFTKNESLIRKSFITLRELRDKFQAKYKQFDLSELSMGMSGDYKIAIEEGSTMVRIGTAIFGERVYKKDI